MRCASQPVPPGLSSIANAHGIEKVLPKTQVSAKLLHSQVSLIIHILVVQDQDEQENRVEEAIH